MSGIDEGLKVIGDFLVDQLRETLSAKDQNHNATGKLSASIRSVVTKTGSDYVVEIWAVDYAKKVDQGQPAGTKVSIVALMKWMQTRGIATGSSNMKAVAFLIQRKIFKEGTPTEGSLQYSKNRKRTEFIKVTLDANAKAIFQMVLDLFKKEFTLSLTNTVSKNNSIFKA